MNLKHKNIMKRNMIRAALFAIFVFRSVEQPKTIRNIQA